MDALWLALAFLLGLLSRHLGLPALVGYLAAGFMLNALGQHGSELLDHIAHAGVLLLLFSVGLKLRIKSLTRPEVWGGGLLHLVISGVLLGLGFLAVVTLPVWQALVLATTLGFSSTVLAAKTLEEKIELRAFHGRLAIGILIIQDLAALALMAFAGAAAPSPWALLVLGLPLLRPLVTKVLDWSGHDELLVLYGLALALVVGGLGFEHLGLSSELGALLLGVLLVGHPKAAELSRAVWSLKEILLVGFFLQIGLMGWPSFAMLGGAGLLALLLPLKAALFFFILLAFRLRARTAFLSALALTSYSEFTLIVVKFMVGNGQLEADWLVLLAISVALSFVITAPVNRFAHALYERLEDRLTRFERPDHHPDEQPVSLGSTQILIVGMGHAGAAAYDFLKKRQNVPEQHRVLMVSGIDSDVGKVERHVHEGRRVVYADAEDPGLWHRLRLEGIKAVVLAMPDPEAKRIASRQLRRRGFQGLIGAVSNYPEEENELKAAGADMTFLAFNEVGVGLAEHVWEALQKRIGQKSEEVVSA
ncbi:MAG TPA: cation:proton antiporter [Candidatus Competibacteraceae bacterium]|nr:cation:proton antiporter [Candidatus Competibacteraceae bacterium]HPF57994.1 cation:proton antiporter [Candidatus Competibacteraceae bacterium]HRY17452.1 cation:proton antiporter [Candidatus Competibacteraceae bacterium]